MRIYRNCSEALSETKREVAEMGKLVKLDIYQDKNIKDDPEYFTRELIAYSYMIHEPKDKDILLEGKNKEWAIKEFEERIGGKELNPGFSWKLRPEVWMDFIEEDGGFSYSYSERMGDQIERVIKMLKENPHSRNAIISIWDRHIDKFRIGGKRRVPCSMFYQVLIRNNKVNLIYNIRSNDVMTHWCYDVWLAISLQEYIGKQLNLEIGDFYQFIGSLHAYSRDLHGIF